MKKILWLAVLLCSTAQAQILIVENKDNNQPIEMATISSTNPNLFTTTNKKGEADISKFQNLEKIEIRVLGFENLTLTYKQLMNWNFEVKLNQKLSLKSSKFCPTKIVVPPSNKI